MTAADAQTLREIEACIARIERMRDWHFAKRDRADVLGLRDTCSRYHQRGIAFDEAVNALRALAASQEQRRG